MNNRLFGGRTLDELTASPWLAQSVDLVPDLIAEIRRLQEESVCQDCHNNGWYLSNSAKDEMEMGHGYSPTPEDWIECHCVASLKATNARLVARCRDLEALSTCYRVGKKPSEALLDRLANFQEDAT